MARRVVQGQDVPEDQEGGACHDEEEELQLVAFDHLLGPTGEGEKEQGEVERAEQHENDGDDLAGGQAVGSDAGVAHGEAAGAGRGKRRQQGIVKGHPRQAQGQGLRPGEGNVDAVQDPGGEGRLGHQLGGDGAGGLRLDQHLGPPAHLGQEGQGEDQHAHAADPGGKRPPEQDAAGQALDGR